MGINKKKDEVLAKYLNGASSYQIAMTTDLDITTVDRYIKESGKKVNKDSIVTKSLNPDELVIEDVINLNNTKLIKAQSKVLDIIDVVATKLSHRLSSEEELSLKDELDIYKTMTTGYDKVFNKEVTNIQINNSNNSVNADTLTLFKDSLGE